MAWPFTGQGVCGHHGGLSPQALEAAEKRRAEQLAREAVARHHLDDDIDPGTALLEEVRRCSGAVKWLRTRIHGLAPTDLVWGVKSTKLVEGGHGDDDSGMSILTTEEAAGVNLWWQLYQQERKHLVAVCKAALDAGVQERQVRLAEQQGELLAQGLQWLLRELGHDGDEQATARVVTMLQCLDGGRVPGAGEVA